MKSKLVLFSIAFFLTVSCKYFETEVPNEENLLKQELNKINWKEVDQYPSVASCDTLMNKEQQKECLFLFLTETIQRKIGIDTIKMLYPELDTLAVKITINTDTTLQFETQQPNTMATYNIAIIDSILQNRLADFPKVEPAVKQGVKVKSQFILPLIIKITE